MPEAIVALGEAKRIVGRLRFEREGRRQHSQFECDEQPTLALSHANGELTILCTRLRNRWASRPGWARINGWPGVGQ